eukprot:TRINITY_DN2533_c0_g1_i1.p1 TRINITY_DN2533_c0_g1~~TRINITY_DN2533_c0_g1_i1.p1  ORF type:complete len:603 (+),score=99.22 TRINITY_DN2533_c0_g1_i1:30-1811(+)
MGNVCAKRKPQGDSIARNEYMTPEERMFLSPLQKWIRFRRFPWKFVIHLLIAVLTTVQMLLLAQSNEFYKGNISSFREAYLPPPSPDNTRYLYTVTETIRQINTSVINYFDMGDDSLTNYSYPYDAKGHIQPIPMTVNLYIDGLDGPIQSLTYYLTEQDPCGPFCGDPLQHQDTLQSAATITLQFIVFSEEQSEGVPMVVQWTTDVLYDFTVRGTRCEVSAATDTASDEATLYLWYRRPIRFWLSVIILLAALLSVLLVGKVLWRAFRMYSRMREVMTGRSGAYSPRTMSNFHRLMGQLDNDTPRTSIQVEQPMLLQPQHRANYWAKLPWSKRLRLFNVWHFVALMTNMFNIASAIITLSGSSTNIIHQGPRFILAISTMFSCVVMLRYFEFDPKFYLLMNTLRTALPTVLRYLTNIAPLFFGYALFGVAFFGSCDKQFGTLDSASVTLFSLLNGDEIAATFDTIYICQPVVSRIYLYSFVALFIYAVLNIFIAILQDAFITSSLSVSAKVAQSNQAAGHGKFHNAPEPEPVAPAGAVPEPLASGGAPPTTVTELAEQLRALQMRSTSNMVRNAYKMHTNVLFELLSDIDGNI